MGIEALKQELKDGKITKEQFIAEAKKLLDAGTITQEEHDSAVKELGEAGGGSGSGTLTAEEVQKMIADAVAAAEQSSGDKVRREYAEKLKKEQEEKDKILKDKMTAEEKAKYELEQAKKDLEERTKALNTKEVALHTVDTLTAKGLPLSFKEFLAKDTVEDTTKVIDAFSAAWQTALKEAVDKLFKANGGDPGKGKGGDKGNNPFDPKNPNLTEQGRIFKEDPEKARRLAKEAGTTFIF